MLHNYNKWKVLQVFFDAPLAEGGIQLRELSRNADLAPTSVKNYLSELEKERLILERKTRAQGYPVYAANRDHDSYKFYKKIDLLLRIKTSGLLRDLQDTFMPGAIILFGSAARGEDTEQSDIDLFVEAKKENFETDRYEKILRRKINLLFERDFHKLSKELKNNLLNGTILYGYEKVF